MANKATIGDLMTPLRSIEACLQTNNEILSDGLTSVWNAIDDLNGDMTRVLRNIERRMGSLEKNAKASATDKAVKGGSMAQVAPKAEKSSKLGDFTKAAEAFNPQNLAAGVKAMSEIKMKDFMQFPKKMRYAAQGIVAPISIMKYEYQLKPAEVLKWGAALNKLGEAVHGFVKDISKSLISMKFIEKFTPRDITKSGLYKATEMVATAIMCNIYGAHYNKKTKVFTGGSFKRALELQRGAKVLGKLGKDILIFDALLALSAVVAPVALIGVAITTLVVKVTTAIFKTLGDKKQRKDLEKGGKALMYMATGILTFEMGILLAAIVAPFAMIALGIVMPVVVGAMEIFKRLGSKQNSKNVKNAAWAITMMGISLIVFTGALVVSALILKAYLFPDGKFEGENLAAMAMTIPVFALMMVGLWAFNKVGTSKNVKSSLKALVAIAAMSIGLVIFSACLYLSNMMTKDMWKDKSGKFDPVAAITTVAVFALMLASTYAFKIAGESLKDIAKGTVSVVLMGIGLALFGIGVSFYMAAIRESSWEDIGKAAALIGIFGVEFIILGVPAVFALAALGSASVALIAVALGIFGFGVATYMKLIEDTSWDDIIYGAKVLGIYGLEFAGLGLASPFILAADLAVTCLGLGIEKFGIGIKAYMGAIENVKWDDVVEGAKILGIYGLEFAGLGLLSLGILAADAAVACMGGALGVFANGIKPFAEIFQETEPMTLIKGAGILGILAAEFAGIGLVSLLIAPAAASISLMGDALHSLGKGLNKWMDAGVKKDDIDDLCYAIDRIKLIFIGQKDEDSNKGFFGKIGSAISGAIAAPFDAATISNTARGLQIAGNAIGDLAVGLNKWVDADIQIEDMANMTTIICSIGETFQKLGAKNANANNGGSLLQSLIGIDFRGLTKTDMELGIRSVEGLGKALTNIAEGLIKWRDTMGKEFEGDKLVQFANNIAAVVGSLGTAFAALASDENMFEDTTTMASSVQSAWGEAFSTFTKTEYKNRVQMGIESVQGLGEILVGIADGMGKMTKIAVDKIGTMPTIDGKNWTVTGGSGALKATAEVLLAMAQVFSKIGEEIKKQGMYTEVIQPAQEQVNNGFLGIGGSTNTTAAKTEQRSYIGLAISSLMGIGDIVGGIADALDKMSKLGSNKNINLDDLYDKLLGCVIKTVTTFTDIASMIEGDRTKARTYKIGGKEYTVETNDTKSFLENVGTIVKMTKDAKEVMTAMPEMIKKINQNKNEFDRFIKNDDNIFTSLSNVIQIMAAFSGAAAADDATAGSAYSYFWYDEKGNATRRSFGYISKKALKQATTRIDTITEALGDFTDMLKKVPQDKFNTEVLSDAAVGVGTFVMYVNAWLENTELESAQTKINKMDTLLDNTNEMLRKIPLEIKLLDDLKTANEGGAAAFDVLTSAINTSLAKLGNRNDTVDKATVLVQELHSAAKAGVFNNISGNVNKMVDSINSLDGEKLKPYADMIMALRDMSAENSKFKELFEEMVKMLADIIKEIKESGIEGNSGSGSNNNSNNKPTPSIITSSSNDNSAAINSVTSKLDALISTMSQGRISGENKKTGETYTITFTSK